MASFTIIQRLFDAGGSANVGQLRYYIMPAQDHKMIVSRSLIIIKVMMESTESCTQTTNKAT